MTTENTWADGDVATAAKLNNLEDTVIVRCTAATRPTGTEGRMIYETDTGKLLIHSGSGWTLAGGEKWISFTPSWTNVTTTDATQDFQWRYVAGGMWVEGKFTFGASTAWTGAPQMTIPNSETTTRQTIGAGRIADGTRSWLISTYLVSSAVIGFNHTESGNGGIVNATNPVTVGSADVLSLSVFIPL